MSDLSVHATGPGLGQCPACARPIAVSGRRCLYCGATLPEPLAPVEGADAPADSQERMFLVVDETTDAAMQAGARGLTTARAAALPRKARYRLVGVLARDELAIEMSRLAAAGVTAHALPAAAVGAAVQPLEVVGGDAESGVFSVGGNRDAERVAPEDVLLLVWGPIRREAQSRLDLSLRSLKRPMSSSIADGELFHVHARSRRQPLEIDPQGFAFTTVPSAPESSLLRVRRGLEALAAGASIDRGFQHEPPALGISNRVPGTLDGLSTRSSGAGDAKPTALDNVAQFRFYSAWRGALARQLAGLEG
jgi:hypothetical protein